MNVWIYVLVMAVLQGVTEFLPVSSSGHLAVLGALFGFREDESVTLGIMLHAGSLLAIIVFYFKLLLGFFRRDQLPLLGNVILGSIPAGVAGILLKKSGMIDALFGSLPVIALAFLVTGALLRITAKPKLILLKEGETPTPVKEISWRQALAVGVAQMFAILPGISRSGATISTGIIAGIERESAAAFSFLLALPAIGGATLLELISMLRSGTPAAAAVSPLQLAVAVAVSAAVSWGALAFLARLVKKGRLAWFSWYLFALGAGILVWQLLILKG